jgi:DNA-binding NarL/FixJ family response regulator
MTTNVARASSIGVALVDDQAIVLAGVAALIEREPNMHLTGTASDIETAIALIEQTKPDVVISDVQIGEQSGLTLLDHFPDGRPPIILLSSFEHPMYYQSALERGAAGYILKAGVVEQLIEAIGTVAAGGISFPAHALRGGRHGAGRRPSRRELDVVHLVAEGASNEEIGGELGISPKTVDSHLRALFDRYGVLSRTELAMLAVSEGWLRARGGDAATRSGRRQRWIIDDKILKAH